MRFHTLLLIAVSVFIGSCSPGNGNLAEEFLADFAEFSRNNAIELQGDGKWKVKLLPDDFQTNYEINTSESEKERQVENSVAGVDSGNSLSGAEASFILQPNVQLFTMYKGEIIYLNINAFKNLPVSVSCEIERGSVTYLCSCSFDSEGNAEKYNSEISEAERNWESINYSKISSGEYHFKTGNVIGEPDLEMANSISEFGKELCNKLKYKNIFITQYNKMYENKDILNIIVNNVAIKYNQKNVNKVNNDSDETIDFVIGYEGRLNSPDFNINRVLEFTDGRNSNKHQTELVELAKLIESEIVLPYSPDFLPLNWSLTIPLKMYRGQIIN